MTFYAFRLDTITVRNPRGKISDNDIVTFSVFVNQIERGRGAGFFPDLRGAGPGFPTGTPAAAVTPDIRQGMTADWIIGPLDIAPGDEIHVVYSGTNTSDSQVDLDAQKMAQVEIKILDSITSAAVGAIGGPVGVAVSLALGIIGDPIGKFLGFAPQGPCNGTVFSDAVDFVGLGLDSLSFQPPAGMHGLHSPPYASEVSFTRSYTDEATHDTTVCGEIAHTDITFSAIQLSAISTRYWSTQLFPGTNVGQGLKQLSSADNTVSMRSLLLRP
jgi:hypothetical protein